MTLTPTVVKQFEQDQQSYGTKTALFNLFWLKAADDLRAIGVTRVKTTIRRKRKVTRD